MSIWKILLVIFLTVGAGIALYSLYSASVSGTMTKLGLVGADFSASVINEKFDNGILAIKSSVQCGLPTRIKGAMTYLLSSDDKQGELSFRLGQDRVKCGAAMIAEGQVETGTYEVLKGIGYLKSGYKFVEERMGIDSRVCNFLPESELSNIVANLLTGTSGRIHELIFDKWGEVQILSEKVEPFCLEQRMRTR